MHIFFNILYLLNIKTVIFNTNLFFNHFLNHLWGYRPIPLIEAPKGGQKSPSIAR